MIARDLVGFARGFLGVPLPLNPEASGRKSHGFRVLGLGV